MAENNVRRMKAADDIMAQACLPEVLVKNGVHKAIRDSIVEALEAEHTEGWNEAMIGTIAESSSADIKS